MVSSATAGLQEINVAHSPDSDDAFMFYGLATNKVRVPGLRFTHTLCDIETLNRKAHGRRLRRHRHFLSRVSLHPGQVRSDAQRRQRRRRLRADDRVATRAFTRTKSRRKRSPSGHDDHRVSRAEAVRADVETEVVPFDQIIPQVLEGKYEAGLIIHEGQLTYSKSGLHRIVDLGKWWREDDRPPASAWAEMPSAAGWARRLMPSVSNALRDSIQYALDHREEALEYAMQFARDLDPQLADKFVGMYVNERTLDYGRRA